MSNVLQSPLQVPTTPSGSVDWDALCKIFPEFKQLDRTPQEPDWHSEGDVGIHTRMVWDARLNIPSYHTLSSEDKFIVDWSIIFHDFGKAACTKEEDGRITSRGHSRISKDAAGRFMWALGYTAFPKWARMEIMGLIAMHGRPTHFLRGTPLNPSFPPEAQVISCSQFCRLDLLSILVEADMRGRICKIGGVEEVFNTLQLFLQTAQELGCSHTPYQFNNNHARFKFMNSSEGNYLYEAYDDTTCNLHILCGIPGAGKSSYRQIHLGGLPYTSLDELRKEIKLPPGHAGAELLVPAYEHLKFSLRAQKDNVWDATNIRRDIRQGVISTGRKYGAKIHIHFIDSDRRTCLAQDSQREDQVGEHIIERFGREIQFPDISECHELHHITEE